MSQLDRLRDALQAKPGEWVPMPTLAEYIGGYAVHSRCAELRRHGYQVENKVEVQDNGQKRSWYRLMSKDTHNASSPVITDAIDNVSVITVESGHGNEMQSLRGADDGQNHQEVLREQVPKGGLGD